ncbi:MAG: conjugal transfer protein TraF [Elusimicrobiales bacterium]|nr:conjugal transfer protein TraF [Elusimicrobiales bacterium]
MKKLLITLTCLAIPASLFAEQWQVLGTRPMGMGGAFVAVAQGPIAQYWNPAGLVKSSANVSGMDIPVGVTAEFTGDIIKNASEIGDMATQLSAIQAAQKATSGDKAITPQEAADFVKTMGLLADMNKPGKGALVQVAGGANFKFSKVALSINNFTAVGANPFIDTSNLNMNTSGTNIAFAGGSGASAPGGYATAASDLATALNGLGAGNAAYQLFCGGGTCDASITNNATLANALATYAASQSISAAEVSQAASMITANSASAAPVVAGALTGGSYTNNTSNLTLTAASFTEIAGGYAWNVDKWLTGLSIGGNIKMINGRLASNTFQFMNNANTGDAFKDMMQNSKSSWAPSADLGMLWNVKQKYSGAPLNPRVGLVMRNINSPKFDRPDTIGGSYKLDRQVRLGFALNPAKFWTLAMDMDLTKNKTQVNGFDSRQLCLGTEINLVNRKAFNIPLRAGIMSNIAEKDSKMAYTVGTGLNLLFMHFDVSGVVSSDRTKLDNKDIPTKLGVAASFGLLF